MGRIKQNFVKRYEKQKAYVIYILIVTRMPMQKSTPKKSTNYKKSIYHLTPSQKTINNILLFAASVQVEKIADDRWLQFFLN